MRLTRALVLLPLLALTGAAPSMSEINNSGRVLAQLDDMRAIYFVLIVVVALMVGLVMVIVVALFRQQAATQKTLMESLTGAVEKLALSLDGMTKAQIEKTTADLVHDALVQSVMTRADATMTRMEPVLARIDAARPAPRKRKPREKPDA
jgi:heme/copper-type cytochrome/quinol oxidase subunit 2